MYPDLPSPSPAPSELSVRVGFTIINTILVGWSGKGNGIPLQCSCLENPRDGGAWWAALYGVAQSWTRLK